MSDRSCAGSGAISRTTESEPGRAPRARPMTSDEVLTVLTDVWRHLQGMDPDVEYEIPLSRETNVEVAGNLLGLSRTMDDWASIAVMFKDLFRVTVDPDEWKAVLVPKKKRALGRVCDLIAQHALAPAVERSVGPKKLNWEDAIFRTILLILEDCGFDTTNIRPSSKLSPLLRKHERFFVDLVSRVAPGRLPAVRTANPWLRVSIVMVAGSIALLFVNQWLWIRPLGWLGWLAFGLGCVGIIVTWRARFATRRVGELITFRDLCYALASPPPDYAAPCAGPDGRPAYWNLSQHPRSPW